MKRALGYDPLPPQSAEHADRPCGTRWHGLWVRNNVSSDLHFFPFSPKSAGRPLPIFYIFFKKIYFFILHGRTYVVGSDVQWIMDYDLTCHKATPLVLSLCSAILASGCLSTKPWSIQSPWKTRLLWTGYRDESNAMLPAIFHGCNLQQQIINFSFSFGKSKQSSYSTYRHISHLFLLSAREVLLFYYKIK